jgi:hypothetical protein
VIGVIALAPLLAIVNTGSESPSPPVERNNGLAADHRRRANGTVSAREPIARHVMQPDHAAAHECQAIAGRTAGHRCPGGKRRHARSAVRQARDRHLFGAVGSDVVQVSNPQLRVVLKRTASRGRYPPPHGDGYPAAIARPVEALEPGLLLPVSRSE